MDHPQPLLSIVIVTYNSRSDLLLCLQSLAQDDVSGVEIIVVDNNSRDGTVQWLRDEHPDVNVIALDHNAWYAGGNNRGIAAARGDYIFVLNPDTELHSQACAELLRVAREFPRGLITAKLLLPDGTVNACGNGMHYAGITTCLGLGSQSDSFHGISHPLLLSGAAILAHRSIWEDLSGFDESFGMYMEDADLSLRARLRGYDIVCAADAEITHRYDLNMSPNKFYFLERNRLLTLLKVYERSTLVRIIPGLMLTEAATATFALLCGTPYIRAWWQAYVWLWRERRRWQAQRERVQQARVASDRALLAQTLSALPFDQLMRNGLFSTLLQSVTGPIYRALKPYRRAH